MTMVELIAWIQGVVGEDIPVILSHQNAPVPTGDFIAVRFVTQTPPAGALVDRIRDEDSLTYHLETSDVLSVDLAAFSVDGATLLRRVALAASAPNDPTAPALIEQGPVIGPVFWNDSHYRPQYHAELRLRVAEVVDLPGNLVTSVTGEGDIADLESAVVTTAEIDNTFD